MEHILFIVLMNDDEMNTHLQPDIRNILSSQINATLDIKIASILLISSIEIENGTISILKEMSYCRRKSSASGPRFKVSFEGLSAEIDIPLRSPIQVQPKADVP